MSFYYIVSVHACHLYSVCLCLYKVERLLINTSDFKKQTSDILISMKKTTNEYRKK